MRCRDAAVTLHMLVRLVSIRMKLERGLVYDGSITMFGHR